MSRFFLIGLCGFLGMAMVKAQGSESQAAGSEALIQKTVLLAEIRGTINPAAADFLQTAIREAERKQAQALIVELDTPGGLVSSTRLMAQAVDASQVPVVVYVTPAGASATSAGALLMLSAHVAAMSDGTNIGAAHPVGPQGKDVEGAMGEKVLNDVSAFARSLAELRGRPGDVAEAVVRKSSSMTAKEAVKKGFIEILASSRSDLLVALNGRQIKTQVWTKTIDTDGAIVETVEMSLGQKLLHLVANPNIAAVLMTLAMLLIYVEVSNPGITIAGVLGAICLLVAFMAFQTLPIQIGGVALLGLGMILMVVELFVAAGGVLAAGGLLAFVLGMIWALDPSEPDLHIKKEIIVGSAVGLGTGIGLIVWAATRMRRLNREAMAKLGGSALSGLTGYVGHVESVEENGRHGKAVFRGEVWEFESSVALERGDEVLATDLMGYRVKVIKKV